VAGVRRLGHLRIGGGVDTHRKEQEESRTGREGNSSKCFNSNWGCGNMHEMEGGGIGGREEA